jgi:hypothetical protein
MSYNTFSLRSYIQPIVRVIKSAELVTAGHVIVRLQIVHCVA